MYGREAMEHLKSIGIIVYLQLSCESLKERLGDLEERGVSMKEGQTLEEYEKYAELTVDCENKEISCIAKEIASHSFLEG